jgi:hypothetical protein
MKRLILVFVALVLLTAAQSNLVTIADITGDGANHAISATTLKVRWMLVIADSGNAADVRIGDSNISATRGAVVSAGGGLLLPPSTGTSSQSQYDLSNIYYRAGTGDKISVTGGY